MKTIQNKGCRICGEAEFDTVIDFGENPLVNSLIEEDNLGNEEPVLPLVVKRCRACAMVQVVDVVDSQEIYKDVDYLYFSGDMPKLSEYFKEYADEILDVLGAVEGAEPSVLEIGANDGTMLKHFADRANRVLGVDPASNVVVRALRDRIPVVSEFFSHRLAKSIYQWWGRFDVIYGNNCIAHLNNLRDLMEGVRLLIREGGIFVVECNYWGNMVKNKNYALIYHDHFSYFTLTDWMNVASRFGLNVFDAWVTPAQGGSLRVYMQRGTLRKETDRMKKLKQEEDDTKLATLETCQTYEKDVRAEAQKLYDLVTRIKVEGKIIAGYGAAAKGFSVLKLAGINQEHIDYFVDDSPAKQGKYTPVTHIPVISRAEAEDKLPDYFFITAPNYEKIIVEKEKDFLLKGGKFITCDSRIIDA